MIIYNRYSAEKNFAIGEIYGVYISIYKLFDQILIHRHITRPNLSSTYLHNSFSSHVRITFRHDGGGTAVTAQGLPWRSSLALWQDSSDWIQSQNVIIWATSKGMFR